MKLNNNILTAPIIVSLFISSTLFSVESAIENPVQSNRLLSRQKRFTSSSLDGWTFTVKFTLNIPAPNLDSSLELAMPFSYTIESDSRSRFLQRSLDVSNRRFDQPFSLNQWDIVSQGEKYISQLLSSAGLFYTSDGSSGSSVNSGSGESNGRDGIASHLTHACTLRLICEVSSVPDHETGVLGHLLNLIVLSKRDENSGGSSFNNSTGGSSNKYENDYESASYIGKQFGDCSQFHNQCSHSLFEIVEYSNFA